MPTVIPPTASPLHFENSLGVLAALKGQARLIGQHGPSVSGSCLRILSFLKDVTGAGLRQKCFLSAGWTSCLHSDSSSARQKQPHEGLMMRSQKSR